MTTSDLALGVPTAPTDSAAVTATTGGRGLDRRGFLRLLGGTAATGAAAPLLQTSYAFADADGVDHTLVVVFLRGGMDGCSVVVPASDGRYHDARPGIAVPEGAALGLDGRFGLHPAMGGLHRHFHAGRVAFVPASGSDLGSRSHFEQQNHIERGGASEQTGWLTRHLLSRPGHPGEPVDALSVSGSVPRSLAGPSGAVASSRITDVELAGFHGNERAGARTVLERWYGDTGDSMLGRAAGDLFAAIDVLVAAAPGDIPPAVAYPEDAFGRTLQQVAQVVKADIGADVVTLDVGGWDTHTGMGRFDGGQMATKLAGLSAGLTAFADDLGGRMDRVTVVCVSEFGRRLAQNRSGGTDHGRGGVMILLGGRVAGGVHGTWPGLDPDSLDRGDVAAANDVRAVLADVLVHHQRNPNVGAIFPGYGGAPLRVTR